MIRDTAVDKFSLGDSIDWTREDLRRSPGDLIRHHWGLVTRIGNVMLQVECEDGRTREVRARDATLLAHHE